MTVTPIALDAGSADGRLLLLARALGRTNRLLLEAFRNAGLEAAWTTPDAVAGEARPGDTVLGRVDVLATLDGVEPGIWELRRLERDGVGVLNPARALLASHDKLATARALARRGVPHPRTALVDARSPVPELRTPAVVKPRFGSWGRDVVLCETQAELARCLAGLRDRPWFARHGAVVQDLVPPVGYDLRLIVAAGTVAGAIRRVAAHGEWRTNIALGGRREPVAEPPPAACALAVAAAAAVGGDLIGVDLLPAGGGEYVVLEVNGAADFTRAYSPPGREIFADVADALVDAGAAAAVAVSAR
jgi:RimK family alpha-L-glutamate ligase